MSVICPYGILDFSNYLEKPVSSLSSLEVVALGMSCRLRAEVLLRQCETGTCPYVLSACDALSVTNRSGQIIIGLTW